MAWPGNSTKSLLYFYHQSATACITAAAGSVLTNELGAQLITNAFGLLQRPLVNPILACRGLVRQQLQTSGVMTDNEALLGDKVCSCPPTVLAPPQAFSN